MTPCESPARYCYSLYGVRITSDFPFEFPAGRDAETSLPIASVEFVEAVDSDFECFLPPNDTDEKLDCQSSPGGPTYIRWPRCYDFSISADGSRIACRAMSGCDPSVLQNFIFGRVLAIALVHQGIEPLHAAVVEVGDHAVGFLGDCAFGKSTLLAAFVQAGYRAVTDDMLIVGRHDRGFVALPGSGRLKLQPDSARRFLGSTDDGTPVNPLTEKRAFDVDASRRRTSPLLLRHLLILPDPKDRVNTAAIGIHPASRAEMARELVKNTFTDEIMPRDRVARQFIQAVQVASAVDGFRLRYPSGLEHLEAVRNTIIDFVLHGDRPYESC